MVERHDRHAPIHTHPASEVAHLSAPPFGNATGPTVQPRPLWPRESSRLRPTFIAAAPAPHPSASVRQLEERGPPFRQTHGAWGGLTSAKFLPHSDLLLFPSLASLMATAPWPPPPSRCGRRQPCAPQGNEPVEPLSAPALVPQACRPSLLAGRPRFRLVFPITPARATPQRCQARVWARHPAPAASQTTQPMVVGH